MQNTGHEENTGADSLLTEAQRGASAAKRKAGELASDLKSSARNKAAEVRDDAIKTARDGAAEAAEMGKSQTRKVVSSLGRALEAGGKSLEDDGLTGTAGYVRAAGKGLEDAANEIGGLDATTVGQRIEGFVRARPMVTVGALAFVGFALASTLGAKKKGSS